MIRNEIDPVLKAHNLKIHEVNASLELKREAIRGMNKQIADIANKISEHRTQTSNIDKAIENINRQAQALGLQGFELKKLDGEIPRYRIVRENETEGVYKTLSEGEKTLITFLYFLECCDGTPDANSQTLFSNRIIVIDDPISSLSHNYIYDIAVFTQSRIIKSKNKFRQIFILTHNLFFYHELIKLAHREADKYQYFRVSKAKFSNVISMEKDEIQNEYQSYWKVLLDAKAGLVSSVTIPNMMRNILEHYFAFIHRKDKLEKTLEALGEDDIEFKPLWRYINRGSHSDQINITDFGVIDPEKYMNKFRDIFKNSGHLEHYQLMSGEIAS